MSLHTKVSGTWKEVNGVYVKVSGAWKECDSVHTKVSGAWKEVYSGLNGVDDYTVLLMHCDGDSGFQTFTDSSIKSHKLTAGGNAMTHWGAKKFGKSSLYLDGTGDIVAMNYTHDDLSFGTGAFCIEFWMNVSGTSGSWRGILSTCETPGQTGYMIGIKPGTRQLALYQNNTERIVSSSAFVDNTWAHVAVVRNGNTVTMYLNGVSVGTWDATGVSINAGTASSLVVGRYYYNYDGYYVAGYFDEIRISKGVPRYTGAFTPPVAPFGFKWTEGGIDQYTSLCLHCEAADGTIMVGDSSWHGREVICEGGAQIDTAQYKFGSSSLYFDGTGDYCTLWDTEEWYLYNFPFTIDLWVRLETLPSSGSYYNIMSQATDATNYWRFSIHNDAGTYKIRFQYVVTGTSTIDTDQTWSTPSAGVWYHIALVRSGNDFKIFVDGTQIGSTITNSNTIANLAGPLCIGMYSGTAHAFKGWMDEIRFSRGIARWTSNFTPPSAPYSGDSNPYRNDGHTALLLRGGIGVDGSTQIADASWFDPKAIDAISGNTQVDTGQSKFDGTSIQFDGTDDFLRFAPSTKFAFGRSDFTIDFWVRFNAIPASGYRSMLANQYKDANNMWYFSLMNDGGTYKLTLINYVASTVTIDFRRNWTPSTGVWYHVALVRKGSEWKFFVDGSQVGTTYTDTDRVTYFAGYFYIGTFGDGNHDFNGWLDEYRISRGIARWWDTFTPPARSYR